MPPGATDQDYHILQSPINGDGDSILLGDVGTMRLFWAGEHTTALHPSMAHGALLSGFRAAKEVIAATHLKTSKNVGSGDRPIPMTVFRSHHPTAPLQCHLCHLPGSRKREGGLFAFQRFSRQVIVHNNCAVFSPEVECADGKWKNVIKAVNRGKQIQCLGCGKNGATIGCVYKGCVRSFHFGCAELNGWDFEEKGKEFHCDVHQRYAPHKPLEKGPFPGHDYLKKSRKLSQEELNSNLTYMIPLADFTIKPGLSEEKWQCALCKDSVEDKKRGLLVAFQQGHRQDLTHFNCVRYSTNVHETPNEARLKYQNVADAVHRGRQLPCWICSKTGATIKCANKSCHQYYHFVCAEKDEGWNFEQRGRHFLCLKHRAQSFDMNVISAPMDLVVPEKLPNASTTYFDASKKTPPYIKPDPDLHFKALHAEQRSLTSVATTGTSVELYNTSSNFDNNANDGYEYKNSNVKEKMLFTVDPHLSYAHIKQAYSGLERLVIASRASVKDLWNIRLLIDREVVSKVLSLRVGSKDGEVECNHGLRKDDIIISINNIRVGSSELSHIGHVLALMRVSLQLRFKIIHYESKLSLV